MELCIILPQAKIAVFLSSARFYGSLTYFK
jgi:hypothetical protein